MPQLNGKKKLLTSCTKMPSVVITILNRDTEFLENYS